MTSFLFLIHSAAFVATERMYVMSNVTPAPSLDIHWTTRYLVHHGPTDLKSRSVRGFVHWNMALNCRLGLCFGNTQHWLRWTWHTAISVDMRVSIPQSHVLRPTQSAILTKDRPQAFMDTFSSSVMIFQSFYGRARAGCQELTLKHARDRRLAIHHRRIDRPIRLRDTRTSSGRHFCAL
jgi:hypothetical protein